VAAARRPLLYERLGVPDTVDGRFEMIVLHMVLLFHRLGRDGEAGKLIGQGVFDAFIPDMDRSIREMGVGDLGVPRRMKAVGRSFYGRLESYGRAIADGDRPGLSAALARNLVPTGAERSTAALAEYAFDMAARLALVPTETFAAGRLGLAEPQRVEA
jgi:cytochrome b pre-mRNA-processing protein 3